MFVEANEVRIADDFLLHAQNAVPDGKVREIVEWEDLPSGFCLVGHGGGFFCDELGPDMTTVLD